jgi:hypothetical protein
LFLLEVQVVLVITLVMVVMEVMVDRDVGVAVEVPEHYQDLEDLEDVVGMV